ncbi:SigE family RNA polymerase sigma factor [Actinomadura sp. WMMA1423]|uniref:SigE family RNA polymerase sigma factor n=1 Tax=Actinomadura sp. WMMA1423 TaxID=2591108 RepID=UPI001146320F|nr:SigE family RNA polymerase sigma factor [Actinomadura sp. WMMA1423]
MDAAAERHFREFVEARSTALMRLAYLLTGGDQHAAEDVLQTALFKTAARWDDIENPEAYVRRVMYRQQASSWRPAWRRREAQVAVPPEESAPDGTSAVDLKLAVRGALACLTPRQRLVLALRFLEDLPEAEVARILGCSVGTVRSTTHRSLARLRRLAPELNEPEMAEEAPR